MAESAGRVHFGEVNVALKKVVYFTVVLFGLLLVMLSLGAFFLFYTLNGPPRGPGASENIRGGEPFVFEVPLGESADSIGERLASFGLIRSALLWNLVSRIDAASLKAGTYAIASGSTMLEIRDVLISGRQLLQRVTVPEGYTIKKTAELLQDRGIVEAAAFIAACSNPVLLTELGIPAATAEGFLFPDTYLFPRSFPADRVVVAMVRNFFVKLAQALPPSGIIPNEAELLERLTIASIVEREYRVIEEAPLMAGVFYNRLEIGMPLQSCATVEYIITEKLGKPHPEILYNRDIEIPDPFNTYVNQGLPPGPISSPGLVALRAAFSPEQTDFLYFRLVDPTEGKHRFSRTFDEHRDAGVIYTKRLKAGT